MMKLFVEVALLALAAHNAVTPFRRGQIHRRYNMENRIDDGLASFSPFMRIAQSENGVCGYNEDDLVGK